MASVTGCTQNNYSTMKKAQTNTKVTYTKLGSGLIVVLSRTLRSGIQVVGPPHIPTDPCLRLWTCSKCGVPYSISSHAAVPRPDAVFNCDIK